ncbi:ATP-binding protein [Uliginosibacterium flavum]|uniref:histidine kinase n=1 Tax=Uliginosibacterium flavum TaxID=1396831 RepID=A0ABV2TFU3_9RHOO
MLFDSLKRRIVLLCIVALSVIWLGALAISYLDARKEVRELFDAHLAQAASLLAAQSGAELEEIDTDHAVDLHKYAHSVSFQIWNAGTHLGLHSANAPATALGTRDEGFSDREIDGVQWRVFTSWDQERENLIYVGEKVATRDHLLKEMVEHLLQPMLYALPLLALLLWLAVYLGLRPLDRVTAEIARRDPQRLDAVDAIGAPSEVRPLIGQLNQLLARIAESLDNTRRFTADAAHELRTPLAAIRAQAQVAQGSHARDEQDRAIQQVLRGCDLATHLIEQLLTLARLDASSRPACEPVELRALVAEVLAEVAASAVNTQVAVALEEGDSLQLQIQPGLIRVLLRNLLDNAIRYSPAGSEVSVAIHTGNRNAIIDVLDSGPGIPADQLERVFDRFHRVLGSAQPGSGLGLSIARRIAEIHGGSILIQPREEGAGLRVRTTLPVR